MGSTIMPINQRCVCAVVELRCYRCGNGRTKRDEFSGYTVTGLSLFQLKTPLGFFWAKKANSFQPNPEAKRDYAN
ncbi:hypothetical protein TNCV_1903291 [Trichonephila clavipes]|nr:hypothetical protein TNCV_1903291 [Trichonephila clavipes]